MPSGNSSIKALRKLLADQAIPAKDIAKHIKEITGTNDRLIAIVAASMVELNLETLLRDYMATGNHEKLFGPGKPLASFSTKIEMCYALGLVNSDIRRNADYMREIRNVFAHKIAPVSFKTPEISTVCKLLELGWWDRQPTAKTNMRTRFLYAAINTGSSIAKFRLDANFPRMQPAALRQIST